MHFKWGRGVNKSHLPIKLTQIICYLRHAGIFCPIADADMSSPIARLYPFLPRNYWPAGYCISHFAATADQELQAAQVLAVRFHKLVYQG